MPPKDTCIRRKKLKSKRPKSSDEVEEVSSEALEKLNKLSQNMMARFGLDLEDVMPEGCPPEKEGQDIVDNQAESIQESFAEEKIEPEPEPNEPEVIVFNMTHNKSSNSKTQYKRFMSSKVKAIDQIPKAVPNPKQDDPEEEENLKLDAELNELLKNPNFVERVAASQLTGKARRKFQLQQLVKLGCKPPKAPQHPLKFQLETLANKKRKIETQLEKAKEEGTYTKSLKHALEKDLPKKKVKKIGALKTSMGRVRDGIIYVSKAQVRRNADDEVFKRGLRK